MNAAAAFPVPCSLSPVPRSLLPHIPGALLRPVHGHFDVGAGDAALLRPAALETVKMVLLQHKAHHVAQQVGLSLEQVLSDALFKLAGELSLEALGKTEICES